MPFNDSGEPCGRCLVHLNATGMVRAKWTDEKGGHFQEAANYSTDPKYMYEWCKQMMQRGATFEWDGWTNAVIPITTLHGDLICVAHLMAETERRYNESIRGVQYNRPRSY